MSYKIDILSRTQRPNLDPRTSTINPWLMLIRSDWELLARVLGSDIKSDLSILLKE